MILYIANIIFGLIFGAFVLSNIVLPFTITVPTVRRLRAAGLLVKKIPGYMIFTSPVVWSVLLAFAHLGYQRFFPNYWGPFAIGFCLALPAPFIGTIQGMKRRDISGDFLENYGEYLDKVKLAAHPLFSATHPE